MGNFGSRMMVGRMSLVDGDPALGRPVAQVLLQFIGSAVHYRLMPAFGSRI